MYNQQFYGSNRSTRSVEEEPGRIPTGTWSEAYILCCVAVKAGEDSGEIDPEQGDYDCGHAGNHPETVNSRVLFAEHVAEVKISEKDKPWRQRPELFRVPAPPVTPGTLAPDAA